MCQDYHSRLTENETEASAWGSVSGCFGMPLHKGSLVDLDVPCSGLGPGDWMDNVALPSGSSWGVEWGKSQVSRWL